MTATQPPAPPPVPPQVVAALRAAGCVFAEDEARLLVAAARDGSDLAAMVARRTAGLPLEQILGWAEFCGHRITLSPGVFVPRRRTELLVEQAVALAPPGALVVDLCCGSGAVARALASWLTDPEIHAADVDPTAVACARGNLAAVAGQVHVGDLYAALPATLRGRVDLVVANAPYVPTEAIALLPPEARMHEPPGALDGGADGLGVLRRIVTGATGWLAPGGSVLVESSSGQVDRLVQAVHRAGLRARVVRSAELGGTVVVGTLDHEQPPPDR